MVTIGSLRYDIVADTAKFTSGMTATRRELSAAQRLFNSTRTPTERLDIAMDGLGKAFRKGAIDATTYSRAVKQVKSDHAIAQGGIRGTVEQFKRMPSQMAAAAKGFVAYRAAGLIGGQIRDGLTDAMELEKTKLSFEAMLGSASESKAFVGQLQEIDRASTFDFNSTARAAQLLLGYGLTAKQVIPSLKQLGDISVGNEEKFMGLANAYGQATSMGRLMAQEKNQMINAGFNPMEEIVKRTGETLAELSERMGKGKVSTAELSLALQDATSAGGRFDGMMKRLMESTAGQIDAATTEYKKLRAELATEALPFIGDVTSLATNNLKAYKGLTGRGLDGIDDKSAKSFFGWDNFAKNSLIWNMIKPDTIGDKPSQQYTASQLAEQAAAREAAQLASRKEDPEKQHKEAQEMRAKQVAASEAQTAKTQELIDAQPVAVE